MADIVITTNGTVEGTKLTVDSKDITKKEKVISLSLYSGAPYKSSYDNETYPGHINVSYSVPNEDGTVERKSIYSEKDTSAAGIGAKIASSDQVVQFLGTEANVEVSTLVDKIIAHCSEKDIKCPDKESLLCRSLDSLNDKVADLGIEVKAPEAKDEGEK